MNYKNIILSIFILGTQLLNAQQILTLKECRQKAVEHNNELKIANYQKQEAEMNQKAARTNYLPDLSASTSLTYMPGLDDISTPGSFLNTASSVENAENGIFIGESNVWMPGMNIELGDLTYINGSVSLSQAVYAGGKIKYTNKQADAGVEIYDFSYKLKYSEIIEITDQAYWNLAYIKANMALAQKYIEMLTELEQQVTDMYEVGLLPASEKLKVSVQKNEADLDMVHIKNGMKLAKMKLNQVIGLNLSTEIDIADELNWDVSIFDTSNGIESALKNRNEVKMLEKQIEISEYDKKIVQADYLPEIGVSASYSTIYVDNLVEDIELNPMIAGQITIPIFHWRQGKHKKDAAKMKVLQAQTELNNTNELIQLEVQQVKTQLEEAYESIIIAKKNVKEADESFSETTASFEVGLNNTADLLTAKANWQSANARLIDALVQYRVLHTKWLKVTGNLNP